MVTANETIFASLPDPLIMLDDERRVVRANRAADSLFGEPVAGRELMALMRAPALLEAVDAAMRGAPGRLVELSLPVPIERSLRALVEPLPTRIADGTVVLITLHDLTSIKRADQMRADFVANASHELRTPLGTLIGFIETLRGPARDDAEAQDRFLAIMHEQATRMARLVERPAVAVAHRAQRAPAADRAGRAGAHRAQRRRCAGRSRPRAARHDRRRRTRRPAPRAGSTVPPAMATPTSWPR